MPMRFEISDSEINPARFGKFGFRWQAIFLMMKNKMLHCKTQIVTC